MAQATNTHHIAVHQIRHNQRIGLSTCSCPLWLTGISYVFESKPTPFGQDCNAAASAGELLAADAGNLKLTNLGETALALRCESALW